MRNVLLLLIDLGCMASAMVLAAYIAFVFVL